MSRTASCTTCNGTMLWHPDTKSLGFGGSERSVCPDTWHHLKPAESSVQPETTKDAIIQILGQNAADHANQAGKFALEILQLRAERDSLREALRNEQAKVTEMAICAQTWRERAGIAEAEVKIMRLIEQNRAALGDPAQAAFPRKHTSDSGV